MAITINQNPEKFTPTYNDIIFVVTSNNAAQTNFKYIADVVINGVSRRLKLSPNPTYGSVAFNVGRIVESFVHSDISKTTYGFQQNLNSYVPYTVEFGEEYGPSSGTTIYPALTISAEKYAYNGEFDFLSFQDYDDAEFVLNTSTAASLLTNIPSTISIRDSEDAWLHFMTDTSGTIKEAQISLTLTDGTPGGFKTVPNPFQACTSTNDKFIRFGCGTRNLNLIPSSGVTGGQPIISASIGSYAVEFLSYSGATIASKVFNITNTCTKNTVYRFHFLNELGGFDSFSFIRGSNKKVDIKRDKYKKVIGGLTSATTYGYSKSDRGDNQYNTSLKDTIKVKSDWISEAYSTWLEELVTSPEVYLDDPTHGLVAVTITNSSYDFKQTAQDKLFNLEIDFEYSFNRYRQRR